jgi:hypothetical protein
LARGSTLLVGALLLAVLVWSAALPTPSRAQDLGHKLAGSIGLDAGTQPEPGLYLADRTLYYRADRIYDRDGNPIAVEGLSIEAVGTALGVAAVFAIPNTPIRAAGSFAVPLAASRVRSEQPFAHVDRFGLGDIAFQPLQLALHWPAGNVVVEYAVYLPTGRFEPKGGNVSRGHITHQFSLGGTAGLGPARRWFASALLSYDINHRKRGFDVTRGDTVQLEGGAGVRPWPVFELGVAGYALAQVEDDHGSQLPEALRGARERSYALGPELALQIPSLGVALRLRCEFEFGATSRPSGQLLVFGISFAAMRLKEPQAEPGVSRVRS